MIFPSFRSSNAKVLLVVGILLLSLLVFLSYKTNVEG
jgi:hypothetical protein